MYIKCLLDIKVPGAGTALEKETAGAHCLGGESTGKPTRTVDSTLPTATADALLVPGKDFALTLRVGKDVSIFYFF